MTTATPPIEAEVRERISPGAMLRRLARGELGSVRVLLGIAIIWTIFQIANDRFLSAVNLSNLTLQIAAVATISIGVVLVLLLGEIDLSVGAVSGLAASVMAVVSVKEGIDPALAIVVGLLVGTTIGLFNGFMVTTFGIPSFVVTLAGLLAFQGMQLLVLGDTGSVNLPDSIITDLTSTFFDPAVGWILAAVAVAAYAGALFMRRRGRVTAGLEAEPVAVLVARVVVVAAAIIAVVAILNADRGVPLAAVIVVVLTIFFSFLTERTRWGRHVFAVGGNEEAARRAGIRVTRIKVSVFALASTLAAAGGVLAASRLLSVNQQSGSGDTLLLAIAGPVIAGTSLFGGRGFIWSALLGALVIGSISNGMDLVALDSDLKFMITGAVLLLAVTIDAITRRQRQSALRPGARSPAFGLAGRCDYADGPEEVMKADYDSRANAIAITLVEVEASTSPAQEDRVHDRAGVALVDGHPVHIEILYPDHGIDEPLAAVAARYPLDVELLRAAARSALEAPDRVVTLDVAARG